MKNGFENRKIEDLAWEMFEKTGNISYYMLYHDLKRKK